MFIGKCHSLVSAVLILLGSGLSAVSCHREDPVREADAIRFHISDDWQPMSGSVTKATLFDEGALSTGSTFMVDAFVAGTATKYINSELASYQTESTDWRFGADYYWPMSDALDFLAWMPADRTDTHVGVPTRTGSAGPSFTCSGLPMTSAGQAGLREFVYAWKTGQSKADPGGSGVTLAFKHPFSIITIQVKQAHPYLTLNSIAFSNLYNSGTFSYDTSPQWTPTGTASSFVATVGKTWPAMYDFTDPDPVGGPYLILPQTFAGGSQTVLMNVSWPGWTDNPTRTLEATIPVPEWEPGRVYNYMLDLGDNDDIRFLVSVESWSADEDNGATVTFGDNIRFQVVVKDWTNDTTQQIIL